MSLRQVVGGRTADEFSMLHFNLQENNLSSLNEPFFIWEECCHQMLVVFTLDGVYL